MGRVERESRKGRWPEHERNVAVAESGFELPDAAKVRPGKQDSRSRAEAVAGFVQSLVDQVAVGDLGKGHVPDCRTRSGGAQVEADGRRNKNPFRGFARPDSAFAAALRRGLAIDKQFEGRSARERPGKSDGKIRSDWHREKTAGRRGRCERGVPESKRLRGEIRGRRAERREAARSPGRMPGLARREGGGDRGSETGDRVAPGKRGCVRWPRLHANACGNLYDPGRIRQGAADHGRFAHAADASDGGTVEDQPALGSGAARSAFHSDAAKAWRLNFSRPSRFFSGCSPFREQGGASVRRKRTKAPSPGSNIAGLF